MRVISGTRKFDRGLSRIICDDLHWLNVPQCVTFKVCMTVYKCLHGLAPPYLAELCVPVADVGARRRLRSASRGLLDSPRFNMSNYGRRAFSFAGPRAWKSLPEYLRQASSFSVFKRFLKTYLFKSQNASSALETICNCIMGYISVLFTHLLTLLMVRDGQGKSIRHAQYPVTVIPQVLPERIGQLSE